MVRLDLGCGNQKTEGCFGVELTLLPGVDVLANLESYPLPFADSSITEIFLTDVIEHLNDPVRAIEEIHRILEPNGTVHIQVVNWNHRFAAMDPTHKHYFTSESFEFFTRSSRRPYYSTALFERERLEYMFDRHASRYLRSQRLMLHLSQYLCNILQGIRVTLRAVK